MNPSFRHLFEQEILLSSTCNLSQTKVEHLYRQWNCRKGELQLRMASPRELKSNEVRVSVHTIGLCRTDMYAIRGQIPTCPTGFVPGHEFCGSISEVGADVVGLQEGDWVVVNPILSCDACPDCLDQRPHRCAHTQMLGVDQDGAFQERVCLPAKMVVRVPMDFPAAQLVFAEPIAATLGILNAGLSRSMNGLILGTGRIATLAQRCLEASGFPSIQTVSLQESRRLADNQFDFAVEAEANSQALAEMFRIVKPHGKLVLKSRQLPPVAFCPRQWVAKQQSIQMVHYGCFAQAIDLLLSGRLDVGDLIGRSFPLDQLPSALTYAEENQGQKTMIVVEEN